METGQILKLFLKSLANQQMYFKYLVNQVLPDLIRKSGAGVSKKLMVWSAGCSSGEEPYTLSMVLHEFALRVPGFKFEILATDTSPQVLEKAGMAIYDEKKIEPVSVDLKKKYFLRGRDSKSGMVRIIPKLRAAVKFRRLNFIEEDFRLREKMDIIFCRSRLMSFDRALQEKILNRFCRHLNGGGYVFMEYSQAMKGLNVPLKQVSANVYQKPHE